MRHQVAVFGLAPAEMAVVRRGKAKKGRKQGSKGKACSALRDSAQPGFRKAYGPHLDAQTGPPGSHPPHESLRAQELH